MRARVQQVRAALTPHTHRRHRVEHAHENRGTVDHGRIDHLPLARLLRLEERADDAKGEEHAATAEVADQVERGHRSLAATTDRLECTGERDVVDVVSGGLRVRAFLTPAGHAAVDELGVAGQAHIGPEAQALGDAGAKALEERIGLLDEAQHRLDAIGVLQVHADRATAAREHVLRRGRWIAAHDGLRALNADHVGAHVREEHPGERPGTDPRELDDRHPVQWSRHGVMLGVGQRAVKSRGGARPEAQPRDVRAPPACVHPTRTDPARRRSARARRLRARHDDVR